MQRVYAHIHVILAYVLALPALAGAGAIAWLVWHEGKDFLLLVPLYLAGLALCGAYERIIRDEATRGQIARTWIATIILNGAAIFAIWYVFDLVLGPMVPTGIARDMADMLLSLLVALPACVMATSALALVSVIIAPPKLPAPEPPAPAEPTKPDAAMPHSTS